jgi:hypothetical protein
VAGMALRGRPRWARRVALLVFFFVIVVGSRVQHDAPGALRGLFFHSRRVAWWCVQRLPPLRCSVSRQPVLFIGSRMRPWHSCGALPRFVVCGLPRFRRSVVSSQ